MPGRDYRDILGGGLLVAAGLFILAYALTHYPMGTLRMMGPGLFPAGVGVAIAVFGVLIAVPAFFRGGELPTFEIRSAVAIMASVAAFALLVRTAGMIPAIIATTVISSLAEPRFRPLSVIGVCLALGLLSWLIFRVGLGLPFTMFRWPF